MFRQACEWVKPLPKGVKPDDLLPGMLLFRHAFDGGEPAKYKADGRGNARHVGLYCGLDGVEVAHSTSPGAQTGKLADRWTHYGPYKGVAYGGEYHFADSGPGLLGGADADGTVQTAVVTALAGTTVNLRDAPGHGSRVTRVPIGAVVRVHGVFGGWARVEHEGRHGYMMTRFLRMERYV